MKKIIDDLYVKLGRKCKTCKGSGSYSGIFTLSRHYSVCNGEGFVKEWISLKYLLDKSCDYLA